MKKYLIWNPDSIMFSVGECPQDSASLSQCESDFEDSFSYIISCKDIDGVIDAIYMLTNEKIMYEEVK